ncbi:MAG: hypothetical protein EBR02_07455 [Alphaproteobacteria bacterium]|nr:hypothetical protein [Alphaproteobacteria bacterium]
MQITPPYISALSGISENAPAFTRSYKILSKAAEVGFVWPNAESVLGKMREELAEVGKASAEGDKAHLSEEIGDLLSATTTLICYTRTDPANLIIPAPQPQSERNPTIQGMEEKIGIIHTAILSGDAEAIKSRIGDLVRDIVTFAHNNDIDAEKALQDTNNKFVHRFDHVGRALHKTGRKMTDTPLKEMIKLWNQCKPPVETASSVARV